MHTVLLQCSESAKSLKNLLSNFYDLACRSCDLVFAKPLALAKFVRLFTKRSDNYSNAIYEQLSCRIFCIAQLIGFQSRPVHIRCLIEEIIEEIS